MKFTIIDRTAMKIEHPNKKPIIVNIREFSKTKFITQDDKGHIIDPFLEINLYMESLKREDRDTLFNCYDEIFGSENGFGIKMLDIDILYSLIQKNFKTIYDIIEVQAIQDYLEKNNLFQIPPTISENFTGEYTESRTYNVSKYKGLIALSIATRMALPVWGEFAPMRKNIVGSSRLPIPMMKMLVGSSILESKQFKEYELYSNTTVDAGEHIPELVASGLGTEFNVTINLAANFVKRVATGLNIKTNTLARNIYNFTANLGAYNDASGGDYIYAKKDVGGEEEKSKMEKYALREPMSQGDVAMIEYYVSDLRRVMSGVCPDIPDEFINDAEKLYVKLEEEKYTPNPINLRLIQWTMAYLLPPKVIRYVGFSYQRKAVAAATYILAYLGFPRLSALCVSFESVSKDGMTISARTTRREMPEDIKKQLDIHYPLRPKSKEANNMAILAINQFYALVNNTVFKVVADDVYLDYLAKHNVLNKHMCHGVKADNPIELANMIIMINDLENGKADDNHTN